MFIAFHESLRKTGKFAVCRFVKSLTSSATLVALVPSMETAHNFYVRQTLTLSSFAHLIEKPALKCSFPKPIPK